MKPYRATPLTELQGALASLLDDGMQGLLNFQGGLSLRCSMVHPRSTKRPRSSRSED